MDCGIPFCNQGCPLGNIIPDWNDLVYRDQWREAIERLHATNNFPEFTGRLCPAPCEAACVLGINQPPGHDQADRGRDHRPRLVAKVGSSRSCPSVKTGKTRRRRRLRPGGPGRRAAADPRRPRRSWSSSAPTASAGCSATASPTSRWRSASSTGGSRRCEAEGTEFRANANVGVNVPVRGAARASSTRSSSPAARPRRATCRFPAASSAGSTRRWSTCRSRTRCRPATSPRRRSRAEGKHVVIIGGGDTGADCLGTANRQGAASVVQLEIMPRPPATRADATPWPTWPLMYCRSVRARGGRRAASTRSRPSEFLGDEDGNVRALQPRGRDGRRGRPADLPAGRGIRASRSRVSWCSSRWASSVPSGRACSSQLGVDARRTRQRRPRRRLATTVDDVYVCGDMGRGQSLIVWAIAEGRACAAAVDHALAGASLLPAPVVPSDMPLR